MPDCFFRNVLEISNVENQNSLDLKVILETVLVKSVTVTVTVIFNCHDREILFSGGNFW